MPSDASTRRSASRVLLGGGAWPGAVVGLLLGVAVLGPLVLGRAVPSRLDLADFFWPMKAFTAAQWRTGVVPLWNPLSGCGEPWLAQLQSGVLYPPDLVFLLPWPWGAWIAILLHVLIGASGMSAWLRDLGASRGAAAAGAGLFAASGAFLSLVPVLNNAWTAAWLPWVFLAARRAATGGSGAGLALAGALAFLAGEPVLAAVGVAAAVAVALATRREDRPAAPGAFRATAAGLVLAAGIACAAAWPFGELLARSGRLGSVTRTDALARPVGASEIGDLVVPPREEATRTPGRGGYLVTLAATPLVFVLAAAAGAGFPGRRRFLLGIGILGALGLLAALGPNGGLVPILWDAGLWRGVRFPARLFVFTHVALCVTAAAGWDGWLHGQRPGDDPEGRRELRAQRASAVAALAALGAAAVCALATARVRDARGAALVLAASLAGGAVLARAHTRGSSGTLALVLGLALLAPLPFVARAPLEGTDASALASAPPIASGMHAGRLFTAGSDLPLLTAFTQPDGRWDASVPLRSRSLLAGYTNLGLGLASATSASPIRNVHLTRLLGAALAGGSPGTLLALADVRHLVTPFPTRIPGARLAAERGGVRRYVLPPGAGRFFFPRAARTADDAAAFAALRSPEFAYDDVAFVAPADVPLPPARPRRAFAVGSVLSDEAERTEIATTCSAPGLVVFTRSHDPGWTAAVDGAAAPVLRADLAFLAVAVPAGEHRVLLTYAPRSWRIGRIASAVSLLVAAALWLGAPARRIA